MDKIMTFGLGLILAVVLISGAKSIVDLNDGRVLAAVQSLSPSVQSANAGVK